MNAPAVVVVVCVALRRKIAEHLSLSVANRLRLLLVGADV